MAFERPRKADARNKTSVLRQTWKMSPGLRPDHNKKGAVRGPRLILSISVSENQNMYVRAAFVNRLLPLSEPVPAAAR
jgi:hypothetical protein